MCVQPTCKVFEGTGSAMELKHTPTDVAVRLYSTEFTSNGSPASANFFQAVAGQIVRNTNGSSGMYTTTRADDKKTGERVNVMYLQVLFAYALICWSLSLFF